MFSKHLWRIVSILAIFTFVTVLVQPMELPTAVHAAPPLKQQLAGAGPQVISALAHDESRPLASMVTAATPRASSIFHKYPAPPKTVQRNSNDFTDPSIVQSESFARGPLPLMPSPATSFEGASASCCAPADANGDIGNDPATGKKYYMQTVNVDFRIWDVTSPAFIQSIAGGSNSSMWLGFGGICESNNDGDPIVLFDHLAHRWFFSQFAISFPNNFHQCIAVSKSADPTGSWYRYDFLYSTTKLNDYAKFGVWPDGYYMSVNQYDGATETWRGAGVVAFHRAAMLNGQPANMIKFDLGAVVPWYGGMLPSDLDGPAPAAGTPNYFIEWDDSAWHKDPTDTFRIWNFHADWANPSKSTFGANASFDPNTKVATANLDSNMCGGSQDCIAQPGTTQKVDALALGQMMHRLQYRNFGSYQTLVGNQTVDANGADKAGVYWFELRNSGAGWSMKQQGVYSPDASNRWMGSAAMDKLGNLAIGYSVSSSGVFPSVRYAGRQASDPLGTLPQAEASLVAGSGSQIGSNRWGDYSMLTLDPTDDCTFWYTQEYYNSTTGFASWTTRVGSFLFPNCMRTISGNAGTGGVTLSYTDGTPKTVTSQADGSYSLKVPSGWSGTVTATHPCFTFNPTNYTFNNVKTNIAPVNFTATFNAASGCSNIHVDIGGGNVGAYGLLPHGSQRVSFTGINNGPVKIISTNSIPLIGAERVIYKVNKINTSFSEMMGLPNSQLDGIYWLPWYNNADLDTQLRIGNVSSNQATVRIWIGIHEMTTGCVPSPSMSYPYVLSGGQSLRLSCPVNDGPVKIVSTVNIVAAERIIYKVNGANTSFSEMMALPNSQLDSSYWLPWYNNVDLDTQLRFGNVDPLNQATVHVKVGGTEVTGCLPHDSPFTLQVGESVRLSCTGLNNGPVEIVSDNNVPIVASERLIYKVNKVNTSFTEMMALPKKQLDSTYWLPWYNNADLDTQLRFGNVDPLQSTKVHVTINGVEAGSCSPGASPFDLGPGQSLRVSCPGINNGPVQIFSENNVPIVAAERIIYKVNGINTSFGEMMALPASQLNATYWLPWYNNADLDTQLRFGVP